MKKRYLYISRAVTSPRNSSCGSARLADLDWKRGWWTDGKQFGGIYLHVWHKDGETIHRVFCRHSDKPRLVMKKGKLMWLYAAS